MTRPVSSADIAFAHARIAAHILRTPLIETSSPVSGAQISLKLELLQRSGSFKARGAFNTLLSQKIPTVGVAAASGGNHGVAVACAAQALGVAAEIFVPEISTPTKIAKIESFGARIHVGGKDYFEAQARCDAHAGTTAALTIHPYEAIATIAGQGTCAREWEAQLAEAGAPALDTVLVAVGGGGLVAGIAAWFGDRVKVVAVEPEGSCALHAARQAGRPVDVEIRSIAADSLGARRIGDLAFAIAQERVAECVLVEDGAIRAAQQQLWRELCVIAEPGGATAYAALASGAYRPGPNERVGVLVCGGNADLKTFGG